MGLLDFLMGKSKAAPAPAGATDSASAPADAIVAELKKQGFDSSSVDIEVDGAKVTLNGAVDSRADMEKLVLAVGNMKGVAQVENNLVAPDYDPANPTGLYIVQSGDTLSKIAKEHYGDANRYAEIFEANRPMLKDPDHIYPGQRLRIPGVSTDAKVAGGDVWVAPAEIRKG